MSWVTSELFDTCRSFRRLSALGDLCSCNRGWYTGGARAGARAGAHLAGGRYHDPDPPRENV